MENTLNRVFVTKKADLPEKIGKTVIIGSKEMAFFKLANGDIRAIENRCPHKGGVLAEGMISGDYVFCPMHDWKISLIDGKAQTPDVGCVETFQVEVVGEDVYVVMNAL